MTMLETAIPVESEPLTRDDILYAIDERSATLGFPPGEFVAAARAGHVADTTETSELLVLLRLLDED